MSWLSDFMGDDAAKLAQKQGDAAVQTKEKNYNDREALRRKSLADLTTPKSYDYSSLNPVSS